MDHQSGKPSLTRSRVLGYDETGSCTRVELEPVTRFLSRFVGDTPWLHMDLSGHSCKGGLGAVMSDANGFGVAWAMALPDGLKG